MIKLPKLQTIKNLETKGVAGSAGGMTLDLIMPDSTVEERMDIYYNFVEEFDKREDEILKNNPHIFSHRVHWDELPYFDYITKFDLRTALHITFIYSFSGENNLLLKYIIDNGIEKGREFIANLDNKVQRGDLYQMWLPKGKNILRKVLLEVAPKVTDDLFKLYEEGKTYDIMSFTDIIKASIQSHMPEYIRPKYPSKNMSRHIAMAFPTFIDPASFVVPGTGSFRGFQQIFGGKNLIQSKYHLIEEQFEILHKHPKFNLIKRHGYINTEDKVCFFFKYLTIASGWIEPHNCPEGDKFDIIIPKGFSLKKSEHLFKSQRLDYFAPIFIDIIKDLGDGVTHKQVRAKALEAGHKFHNDTDYNYKESWQILRQMAQNGFLRKTGRTYNLA